MSATLQIHFTVGFWTHSLEMEWIPLTQTRNVRSVTKISPMEYLIVCQLLGNLETAEVLRVT